MAIEAFREMLNEVAKVKQKHGRTAASGAMTASAAFTSKRAGRFQSCRKTPLRFCRSGR
jgi:hypothetical protein